MTYTNCEPIRPLGELNPGKDWRPLTTEALANEFEILTRCIARKRLNVDAHALAWNHFKNLEDAQEVADAHAEAHRQEMWLLTGFERDIADIKAEMARREMAEDKDPANPFRDE